MFFSDLEIVTCGQIPMAGAQCCHFSFARNILEMVISFPGTREMINKKIALQIHIMFCNLDSLSAGIQTALTTTHCYLELAF